MCAETEKKPRGFAAMSPEKQREIASKGGRAAQRQGVAHQWTREEAQAAGRKGGEATSRDRAHMRAIGMVGGMNNALAHERKAMRKRFAEAQRKKGS